MVKGIGRAYQIILRAKAKIMNDLEAVGGSLEKPSEELNAAEKLAALNIHALDTVQDQLDRLGRLAGQAEQAGELEEARKAATAAANVALSTTRLQVRVDENTMRLRKKSDLALVLEAFQREIGQGAKIEAGPSAKDL